MIKLTDKMPSRFLRAAILLSINLVAIVAVVLLLNQLNERNLRLAEVRSQNFVLAIDLSLSNEISKIDTSLKTVIGILGPHFSPREKLENPYIQKLVRQQKALLPETESLRITDAAGDIVFITDAAKVPSYSLTDSDYFRALKSGKHDGLLVTRPQLSSPSGNYVMILARAYHDPAGRFAGIISSSIPIEYFNRMLSGFDVGPRGVLSLRDGEMGVIARSPVLQNGKNVPVGDQRVTHELAGLIAAGNDRATYHARSIVDQVERIYSYRLLSNAPIYAHAGLSKMDSLDDWQVLSWRLIGFLGLFLLITNVSAVLLYRQWRKQRFDAMSLRSSNDRLETSLQQLRDRDNALIAAQEAGHLGTYSLDLLQGVWDSSENLDAIFGIDSTYPHDIQGWQQLLHENDRAAMSAYFFDEVIGRRQIFDREYRIARPEDGATVWVHGLGKLEFDADGKALYMRGTIQDISTRRFAEERLRMSQEIFQSAIEGIMVTDKNGIIIETNQAFTRITGYSAEEAMGQNPRILKSGVQDAMFYQDLWHSLTVTGSWEGEFINQRKGGEHYVQYSCISAIRDSVGEISRFAAVISDITELKESQRKLERRASFDELTNLPNRSQLAERMRQAITQCLRNGNEFLGVCYLDLDGFKQINDQWGHDIGDQLLIQVANRLSACTRANDTAARMGGDEFVVLFCNLVDVSDVEKAVSRLINAVAGSYFIGNISATLTLSIGVTVYPDDPVDEPDALIRHADQAMYEAKRNGKNRMYFFDPEGERRFHQHQAQHKSLVEALARDELRLFYQPKVDLRSGMVVGVEALIRWQHPEQGLLQPHHFLEAIEKTELTLPVGEWILHEALQQMKRWRSQGIQLQVSVNIFALHLQRSDFVERLKTILLAYPEINPSELELEILETTAMEDLDEITKRIRGCMLLGVRFSLDDFGTGYSSLTYLQQLPVDYVKIDRSFVKDLLDNDDDQALVRGIVGMAHTLKRLVIAEGVETLEHGIPLLHCGCDLAQGYGIARPMPPEDLPAWLAQWRMPEQWKGSDTPLSLFH